MLMINGFSHVDKFEDDCIIYWIELSISNMPEKLIQKAKSIDDEAYSEDCFGCCVHREIGNKGNWMGIVCDSLDGGEIFYIDIDGEKNWLNYHFSDIEKMNILQQCILYNGEMEV